MSPARFVLLIVPLLASGLFFFNKAFATSDERAVLAVIGRNLLNRREYDTCLATWTQTGFYSGSYGFAEGGYRPDQAWLDRIVQRARGRSVILYTGAPASTRPILISSTLDILVGCSQPIRLSTPIFAGDFAFVSANFPGLRPGWIGGGAAYALQRTGRGWVVVGAVSWSNDRVA